MLDSFISAFYSVVSYEHILFLCLGVILGLAIGILPGLGGIAGLSLVLPFIYGMDVTSALAMLIGLVAVIPTSDTFASVLMGIPGSSGSQATVLDGFPMAKKGQAARALSAAFSASLFGGIFGAIILSLFVLIARPIILAFGSAELFMLTFLGLTMVGSLTGDSLLKGLSACCLGLLLGTVGGAPATGEFRLYFNIDYLMDGIPLVICGLGIFAIPEIIELLRSKKSIAKSTNLGGGWLAGLKDFITHRWLAMRCACIGCVIGALPGLGGSVVDWISYGHAVQVSKDKSMFGKGDVRGVIAPEASNNAKEGGALIPTILFGIPGSGGMAVFLGGMILIGLEPGSSMVSTELDITYTIIWSLALANILGAGICLLVSKWVAKLTTLPYELLAPFMISVILFASFQATRDISDLVVLFFIGILGIFFKRFGWSRPAFLIGYVLASGMENYLYQAVQFDGWDFLYKPSVLVIMGICLLSLVYNIFQMRKRSDKINKINCDDLTWSHIVFISFILFIGVYSVYNVSNLSFLAKIFPMGVSILLSLLSICIIFNILYNKWILPKQKKYEVIDGRESIIIYIVWIGMLILGCYIIGYTSATFIFFSFFLKYKARLTWIKSIIIGLLAVSLISLLSHYMVLELPRGVYWDIFE